MTINEIIELTEKTLEEKMNINEEFIKYSFFEVRIKHNLSEQDTNAFLKIIRNKLENENYNVYFTGAQYTYNNENRVVNDNEILIAIKE